MKNGSSYGLIGILVVLLIFISGGYWYSCSLRTQVTEIWKQTLWEDSTKNDVFGLVGVKVGAVYDPEDLTGLAHYLEHMMSIGSQSISSSTT